jgi:hypothetical protein
MDRVGLQSAHVETQDRHIIAAGLFTRDKVKAVELSLKRVYPVDEAPAFGWLLHALEAAEHIQPQEPLIRSARDDAMSAWQRAFTLGNAAQQGLPQQTYGT